MEIKLDRPLIRRTFFGKEDSIRIVTLREPKVRDFYGLDFSASTTSEAMVVLISRLSGVDQEIISDLSLNDFSRLTAAVNEFVTPKAKR